MVEAIENDPILCETPTAVMCPGCGTQVAAYPTGLPRYVSHFTACCAQCDIDPLERWSVVALDASAADVIPVEWLAAWTQSYWDRHLWTGIETAENCPRTDEFTQKYNDRANAYGWDWQVRCPLCRRPVAEIEQSRLDYHHWRDQPDRGICLCRQCHDVIMMAESDTECDWLARQLELRNKHDLQLARLGLRELLVHPYDTLDSLAHTLVTRYNCIQPRVEVVAILRQTLSDETLVDTLYDETLAAGLDDSLPDH